MESRVACSCSARKPTLFQADTRGSKKLRASEKEIGKPLVRKLYTQPREAT